MLRLLTFGGLSLVDGGAPVTGAASQRSRLALLAVLAAAGPAGVSRDKLLACLWPESEDERARHALKQAVYALRRDLGNENAITGTATLSLDPTIIASDIREFEDAIARGDDATAVALYSGPFLDGVFVRGAAEFDLWAGAERGRLERMCLEAIGRLAKSADERGDLAALVQWWRRAAAAEPLSGRVALSLMRALADSGDVSAAIQHARVHDAVVRAELESSADDAVLSFAEELKRGEYKPTVRVAKPVAQAPVVPPEAGVPLHVASDSPAPTVSAPAVMAAPRPWSRGASIAAFAFALLLLVVLVSPPLRRAIDSLPRSPETSKQIVVAVFENLTGDKALDPLGMLAADYVVRALDNSTFTMVDTRTSALAARWLASSSPAGGSESDRAAALASETRSGTVITGHYYRQGDTLQFEANIIDAVRGVTLHSVGFRGAAADANKLVAELAGRVSARLVSSSDTTAGAATAQLVEAPSIEALEHATRGWELFFRRPFDTTAAFEELRLAIALDSSYTMPFLMRGYILDVKARWGDLSQVVDHLGPHRSHMERVEREALVLFESDLRGDLLGRLNASRELARLSPGSPDMELLVAISAMYINRAAEARASLLKTRTDRGINLVSPMYWAWRAASDHALGRYDDELRSAKQELEGFPNSQTAPLAFARAYAARGNVTALERLLLNAGLTPKSVRPEAMNLALMAGRELRAHGYTTEAQKLFARLAALQPRAGATPAELGQHALAQYEAGDYRRAHAMFSALAQLDSTDLGLLGREATSAFQEGDTANVRAYQQRLATWSRPFAMGEHTVWLAHLAALGGHGDEAVSLLHQAITQGYRPMDLGTITLHEDGDFAPLWKDNAFLALVSQRDGRAALP